MSDAIIKVENISKIYHLYEYPIDRLKESLHPFRKKYHQTFHGLNDVSFEVGKGEVVGIIGKNGSGKSTLLQIITGVMSPTSGHVSVNGKVSALLELGAGFNPEMTGIENVYFYGSLMGFSRQEMDAKVEGILAFADIGEFIHQPVKVYSSGMFVRLAFAAAISAEPDVLIVDEALSVGDLAFKNKCMARIMALHERGTSILFVSHDLSTLQMFCDRVIWMDAGRVRDDGDPVAVTQEYSIFMTGDSSACEVAAKPAIPQQETGMAKFVELGLDRKSLDRSPVYELGQDIRFKFAVLAQQPLQDVVFAVSVYRSDGDWVVGQTSREDEVVWSEAAPGDLREGFFVLKENCLAPGDYHAAFGCYSKNLTICYAMSDASVTFSVRSSFPLWGKFLHPCSWI